MALEAENCAASQLDCSAPSSWRDGLLAAVEERHLLLDAVLEHREVHVLQVGDVAVPRVGHGDVQRHDLDAGAERRTVWGDWGLLLGERLRRYQGNDRENQDKAHD